ncbi:MAG: AraC family transcriptional regulator [Sulfitobacter sp.]
MEFPTQDIHILSLAQLARGQDWRVQLAHDHPHHLLIWTTRGQGVVLLNGMRRGLGTHNALYLPAGSLFALELGRQVMGYALIIPQDTPLRMPHMARHLRIREVQVQSELTGLIEAAQRENDATHPLRADAMEGHAALVSVWLRRQIMQEDHLPEPRNAAKRLSERFCALLPERFASGDVMADYARTLGVTPTHLTRAVRAATGKTASDLLTERILYEARRLLGETDLPALRIAEHLGFGSAAYFTRFMQHHTGLTPSKLRGT